MKLDIHIILKKDKIGKNNINSVRKTRRTKSIAGEYKNV